MPDTNINIEHRVHQLEHRNMLLQAANPPHFVSTRKSLVQVMSSNFTSRSHVAGTCTLCNKYWIAPADVECHFQSTTHCALQSMLCSFANKLRQPQLCGHLRHQRSTQ